MSPKKFTDRRSVIDHVAAMGTECEFDRTGSRRSSRVSSERQVTDTLLPETPPQSNGRSGLGLFDVCPTRGEGAGRTRACGQTLNKPPGTKPRNAAARFG